MASGGGRTGVKPLSRVRVLDLSRLLPGPMATLHLADLGADVIRVEPAADEAPEIGLDAVKLLDHMLTRNKRALRIDLKQAAGREVFLRLARESDVIVESFRPGAVDRLGIGYDAARAVNPRIVYCSISAYGQTGPDRLLAAHDINFVARSGVGDQIGVAGGPPAIPNLQIGDLLGGTLTAVMGILAALVDAQAAGTGRYIDVSMTGSLMAHQVVAFACMMASGRSAPRGEDLISGGLACYNHYRTRDGRYMAVGALEPKFWERLCDALDRPDLKPLHMSSGVREELTAIFAAADFSHWVDLFREVDCCVTPVLTLEEALEGREPLPPPLKMSDCDFTGERPAADRNEILRAAGYGPEEIEALRASGVVG